MEQEEDRIIGAGKEVVEVAAHKGMGTGMNFHLQQGPERMDVRRLQHRCHGIVGQIRRAHRGNEIPH